MSVRLTDVSIRALTAPPSGQKIHLDDAIAGFGVRVSRGGAKTFVLTYGTERRRLTIGRFPVVSLALAREMARKRLAELTLGASHAPPMALRTLVDQFLEEKKASTRPSTFASYKRRLARHLSLTGSVADVTPQKLATIFDRLRHVPQERAHLIVVVKILFRFAERHRYVDRNPAAGFQVKLSTPRERTLSTNELKSVWHACPDDGFGNTVRLLILTGQRRGEIEHIKVDGDVATISAQFTKNKRTHTFPILQEATEYLSKPLGWGGWGKSKARLDTASQVTGWTLHDLRRTYATIHAQLGTPPHVIEALLNHKSGIISGVAQTYNRYRYLDEMRQAVQLFEKHLTALLKTDPTPDSPPCGESSAKLA